MGTTKHGHPTNLPSRFSALLYTLLLVYGTLFPFRGWVVPDDGPLRIMFWNGLARASWPDLITNLFIYLPFGFLLMRGAPWPRGCRTCRWFLVLAAGTLLSFSLEYFQAFLPGRTSSVRDIFLNSVGTGAGAWLALILKPGSNLYQRIRRLKATYLNSGTETNIGLAALGLWALAQLAPLVPSLDLGNLRHGLSPLFHFLLQPFHFSWLQWGEYATTITALGLLYTDLQKYRYRAISRFLLFATAVLLLKVPVVGRQLSAESLLGLMAALALLPLLTGLASGKKPWAAMFLLPASMVLEAVQPGSATGTLSHFNWIPFSGHLGNNLTGILDILAGSWPAVALAYLSMKIFPSSRHTFLTGLLLLIIGSLTLEWLQRFIPGRSPDITDVIIPAIAWAFSWLYLKKNRPGSTQVASPSIGSMHHPEKQEVKRRWLAIPIMGLAVAMIALSWIHSPAARHDNPQETEYTAPLPTSLQNLPANRWIRISQPLHADWRRQNHAGIAYDRQRNRLLIFGSDTHGSNWDNSVHEFDIETLRWITPYHPASPDTYRTDGKGNPVAGRDRLMPWAMHTFDTIVYDPRLDALVVAARPQHNPMIKEIKGIRQHPTWIYDLPTGKWHILENNGRPAPSFFAGAIAYDSQRDVIVGYKYGVWELGPDRSQWIKATDETHHTFHFNMEYDAKRHNLVVFGDGRKTNEVWIYTPGSHAGEKGSWEKRIPGGDPCPRDEHFPVAFDEEQGVFLLLPLDPERNLSVSLVYDPETNTYTRIPGAGMKLRKMNYMMTWDPVDRVFLLVTGYWKHPPTVWALKLDRKALKQGKTR